MIVATTPSKGIGSRKRKRETDEASSSADAVLEKNLKETAPGIEPSEEKRCHLFLKVDHARDNRHHCSSVPPKSDGK